MQGNRKEYIKKKTEENERMDERVSCEADQ